MVGKGISLKTIELKTIESKTITINKKYTQNFRYSILIIRYIYILYYTIYIIISLLILIDLRTVFVFYILL
jgi:hypothetical protein